MNEAIQKFKEMIGQTSSIVVAVNANNDVNKLLLATILHSAFCELNKKSSLDVGSIIDEKTQRFIRALCGNIDQSAQKERLVIKLDSKSMPVSELQYEKIGDSFNIILESANPLNPNNIKIEKTRAPADLLMLIDPKESDAESFCTNTPHKEVVKLSSKDRDIIIKVSEIIFSLFDTIPNKLASPLLYLITVQEKKPHQNVLEILEIKQRLLLAGANQQKINESREEFLGSAFWKLFGRALARSEFEKRLGTLWSFLPLSDFKKTGQDASMITRVFDELRSLRPEANFTALLWEESAKNICAVVGGNDASQLSLIATQIRSPLSSTYFLLNGFETFSEAELKIRSHIQRVL
ncbi:MAG: hypothetical protein AAB795_00675 [Patescibacteria group bacterium]